MTDPERDIRPKPMNDNGHIIDSVAEKGQTTGDLQRLRKDCSEFMLDVSISCLSKSDRVMIEIVGSTKAGTQDRRPVSCRREMESFV